MKKNNSLAGYKDKKVLITGGLGFIGSNLAYTLVKLGSRVTIVDNLAPLYGGNLFNIQGIKDQIEMIEGDIRDIKLIEKNIQNKDFIFNLAAQVSHIDSSNIPFEDLDINCRGHLTLLEVCRKYNSRAKILFSSSRLVLGKIVVNPVTEEHPTEPLSLYGVHKLTAERYYLLYNRNYGLRTSILRLSNPYGERQQIKHSKYSIPGWFMRLAMEGKTISIFGDGKQMRDYIHIDDVVEAFLLVGASEQTDGRLYNCGAGRSVEFREMVELVIKIARSGGIEYVPWPSNYEKEETGNFETDISKLQKTTGWTPYVTLEDGLKKMHEYYSKYWEQYI